MVFDEALQIIKNFAQPLGTERVDLFHSLNRTLAENVYSDVYMPPFNKSAMDGYACRKSDVSLPLQVIEDIPAGTVPSLSIGENQCARIMTGAMVPEGADWVIMKEDVEELTPDRVVCRKALSKSNICHRGEDVKSGELVLEKGIQILPSHIAVLAAVGHVQPLVHKLPAVAILSTGSELVEPELIPGASKIRNSNSYQLMAQARQMGIVADYLGIVPDEKETLTGILSMALENYDVTIISGGVSVGDFDFVPSILKLLKINIRLHGMDVRPGKHMLFGERDGHYVFGLPGNPVSSFVQFEILVKPFLKTLMGNRESEVVLYLPLEGDYLRKKGKELLFIPVAINSQGSILPLEYHGSAHIHAYANAHGIMEIPEGISQIKKGETARVRPL